jgi:LytS/YehU family sensor histidine kinase
LTLALACAIGFIVGDKAGALAGLFGGIAVSYLGGAGFSFTPIVYVVCGYFCGALVGWFLSKNLPSFIFYGALAGIIREIFTVIYYGLFSSEFDLWKILTKTVFPEYCAYIVCIIPAYGIVLGIFTLFKGKDKKGKRKL